MHIESRTVDFSRTILVACLVAWVSLVSALAQGPKIPEVISPFGSAGTGTDRGAATHTRSRLVTVDMALLAQLRRGESFTLTLFDDVSPVVLVESAARRTDGVEIRGLIQGQAPGMVLLIVNNRHMSGTVIWPELGLKRPPAINSSSRAVRRANRRMVPAVS